MTNEQAIEVLNGHIKDSSIAYGTFTGQALHMAIEALKAQLSQEGTTKGTTSDTISRQAAIDAAIEAADDWDGGCSKERERFIRDALEELPSAQPVPSIPLSWIEEHIEWLKSLDNEFANLAATHISVMVKKWRCEQE